MTSSALTRPGERDRLSVKVTQIDWRFVALLCAVAGMGCAMLYSVAKGSWEHVTRVVAEAPSNRSATHSRAPRLATLPIAA